MADRSIAFNKVDGDVSGMVIQAGRIDQLTVFPQVDVPIPRQLPPAAGNFTGRSSLIRAMDSIAAGRSRQVPNTPGTLAIDGIPGVGKTALGVWWAHRAEKSFPDGTLFTDLGGYGPSQRLSPHVVIAAFMQALGVPEELIPSGVDGLVGLYRSVIRRRRVLIVLDNAADADQVRPLLVDADGCLALITSRTRMSGLCVTHSVARVRVDVLATDEAIELVRSVLGPGRVEPSSDIARLVAVCGRLPLALRVAGSRVAGLPFMSVGDVVADVEDGLDALAVGRDESTAVQKVFGWSYDGLCADDARMLRLLGLHPTPEFSVQAAAAFGGVSSSVARRCLERLAEDHMVEPAGSERFRFHDLLYAYAGHRAAVDESPRERLLAELEGLTWYARSATAADRVVFPVQPAVADGLSGSAPVAEMRDRGQAYEWLTEQLPALLTGLRRALELGQERVAVALAAATRFLALRPNVWRRVQLETETVGLTAARGCGDRVAEALFLRRRAETSQALARWPDAEVDLHAAMSIACELGDELLRGELLCGLGRNSKLRQRPEEALGYYHAALPLVRGEASRYVEAVVECNLSELSSRLGLHGAAVEHAERELAIRRAHGDPLGEGYALHDLAVARQGRGEHFAAVNVGEAAIALYRATAGAERYLADALETVARSLAELGEPGRAAERSQEAETIRHHRRALVMIDRGSSDTTGLVPPS